MSTQLVVELIFSLLLFVQGTISTFRLKDERIYPNLFYMWAANVAGFLLAHVGLIVTASFVSHSYPDGEMHAAKEKANTTAEQQCHVAAE